MINNNVQLNVRDQCNLLNINRTDPLLLFLMTHA